jgi:hypothetical protein
MSELRERLEEAVEAAVREGHLPAAAAVVKRGRRRRARQVGATAVLLVVVVAGVVGVDRLTSRPAPLDPTPTAGPTPWTPSVTPLQVKVHPGPYPGPDPSGMVRDVTSALQVCRGATGKPEVRAWARVLGKWWLLAAKPAPPGKALCVADGLMHGNGNGTVGLYSGPWERLKPLQVGVAGTGVAGKQQLGVVSGTVTKQAVRLRVLFYKGRPLDLEPIDGGDGVPVNFFAGFYLETGPPPAEHQRREPSIDRVIAFDQAGNRVVECRLRFGPGNTTTPWRCRPAGPTNP